MILTKLITYIKQKTNHICKFVNYDEKQYFELYGSDRFITYRVYRCECGETKIEKICGSFELSDIPEHLKK